MRFINAIYHASTKTVEYESSCGTRLLKAGGSLNWRFNNPGNLISAKNQPGKIGVGVVYNPEKHSFAIFSSIEAGENAKSSLLKRKYKGYTIPDMMKKYAPGNDGNDPDAYANFIMSESGVTKDEKVGELDDTKFNKVISAISKKEGGLKPGTEKWVYVTNIIVSDGSRPVADVPFKVTLGTTGYEWKTDEYGKLKTIIHTKPGMSIVIKYINSLGQEDVVYFAVAREETKNILLTRNFSQFSAKTLADKPKTPREKSTQKPIEYTVMSGDSLSKIAERYKTSVGEIAKNNNIPDVGKIFPGQRLTIYGVNPDSSSIYLVAPGDTLAKIAAKNDMDVDEIARQNNILDPNKIYPGQSISISKNDHNTATQSGTTKATSDASKPAGTQPQKTSVANTNKKELESVGEKGSGNPIALLPHDQREAPWMAIAIKEAQKWKGADESLITKTSNYHQLIGYGKLLPNLVGSKHAWCASFVNYCLQEEGYAKSKYPFRAKSFIGDSGFFEISKPVYGAIATSGHHATFVYGVANGGIIGLGGNQGGLSIINGSVSAGTIKFSTYNGMRYYLPLAYKGYYKEAQKHNLQEFDINELNLKLLGMTVKSREKESTR
ncbi:LysM peptidoglycan-binding domain-containing protein [Edwardsiella anguillarum]|uniref:LysM peptidoglycan-binding domain-containing protein n=1 Tax=Edwardsiella anguillarum TaxID=1821960 RepID=UPI0024B7C40A|nr:LysM peptidoglycan-binding domain-containing protein [Edwardsiella anguillarum]WHP78807.1 LysM peptidoglycan-binding domain-containing protein [Edwardsiella anguillarum]WHQ16212.1 LysM peptidoglycan-binding domain-containing protein [Edwardsiella anguillarum]WHQ19745.1 LysM peptidoglycan-binding domain-containing protein [Edwardsiella anguillarum]WHQ23268.1 LysM peptidoglycan-binding domain-containing protein [Edwardsiella anguillarum]WHQ26841.1 LysM peptidoglycan-binding domain-containing 